MKEETNVQRIKNNNSIELYLALIQLDKSLIWTWIKWKWALQYDLFLIFLNLLCWISFFSKEKTKLYGFFLKQIIKIKLSLSLFHNKIKKLKQSNPKL